MVFVLSGLFACVFDSCVVVCACFVRYDYLVCSVIVAVWLELS